jgi:nucleolar protein 15
MDSYLLFGHILKAKLVQPSQVHPELFKGCNRRFKVVPWNKMAGKQLELARSESAWKNKISKEEKRRAERAEKLKALGYEFEAPALKEAEAKAQIESTDETAKAIEAPAPAPPAVEEQVKAIEEKEDEAPHKEKAAISQGGKKTKGKKGKKVKA